LIRRPNDWFGGHQAHPKDVKVLNNHPIPNIQVQFTAFKNLNAAAVTHSDVDGPLGGNIVTSDPIIGFYLMSSTMAIGIFVLRDLFLILI
jgi:hypothetical protein